jgi:hypothetical protein
MPEPDFIAAYNNTTTTTTTTTTTNNNNNNGHCTHTSKSADVKVHYSQRRS